MTKATDYFVMPPRREQSSITLPQPLWDRLDRIIEACREQRDVNYNRSLLIEQCITLSSNKLYDLEKELGIQAQHSDAATN